jgi:hypothetical protein
MVLAATSLEGKVELLDPPADAKVGERVTVEGVTMAEPAAPNVVVKKKIFEAVAEGLKVDDALCAVFHGKKLLTTAGPLTVPTAKGGSIH